MTKEEIAAKEAAEKAAGEVKTKLEGISEDIGAKADKSSVETLEKSVNDLIEKGATKEEVTTFVKEMKDLISDTQKQLKGIKSSELASKAVMIAKEFKENQEALKLIAKGGAGEVHLKALTMTTAISGNTNGFVLPDLGQIATRKFSLLDIFPRFRMSPTDSDNGVIKYFDWDEATTARAAAAVAEGAAFPESTAKWQMYTESFKKIGDTLPVTEEFLEDEQMFAADLNMFLETNMKFIEELGLYSGDGVGANLKGITAIAPTYTAVAEGRTDANVYDLVKRMKTAITKSYGSRFSPNVILGNADTQDRMALKKDGNNNYMRPYFVNGESISGMTFIECNVIPDNELIVCDRRFARVYEKAALTFSKGHVGTQFTEDEMTLKVRKRLLLLIRNVDAKAFLRCTDIDAALATLAT